MATVTPIRPRTIRIGRNEDTNRLYEMEDMRSKVIEKCALEWARVMGHDPKDRKAFWETYLPQQLYDIMDTYDNDAVKVACAAYLEDHCGATVTFAERTVQKA